jgi:hypothetical protein
MTISLRQIYHGNSGAIPACSSFRKPSLTENSRMLPHAICQVTPIA